MKIEAIGVVFDGRSSFAVMDRFLPLARRQYRGGTEYSIVPHQGRSTKAHGLYFKCVEVAWQNLPEQWQRRRDSNLERFPTSSHLRKWALIQEGFADEHTQVCDSEEQAMQFAALCRALDEYAVIKVSDDILTVWTAQSQDSHHMGHDDFQRSMDKVLSRLSQMLGITSDELTDEAKRHMVRRGGEFSAQSQSQPT